MWPLEYSLFFSPVYCTYTYSHINTLTLWTNNNSQVYGFFFQMKWINRIHDFCHLRKYWARRYSFWAFFFSRVHTEGGKHLYFWYWLSKPWNMGWVNDKVTCITTHRYRKTWTLYYCTRNRSYYLLRLKCVEFCSAWQHCWLCRLFYCKKHAIDKYIYDRRIAMPYCKFQWPGKKTNKTNK